MYHFETETSIVLRDVFSGTPYNQRFFRLIKSSRKNTNSAEKKQNPSEVTNWE